MTRSDHGTAQDAIDFALLETYPIDGTDFLRDWRTGDLDDWPEFYEWLDEERAQSAAADKVVKGWSL